MLRDPLQHRRIEFIVQGREDDKGEKQDGLLSEI